MSEVHDEVARHLDAIEAELRTLGWWDTERPSPEAFEFQQAFAIDTMAYAQWLVFVFVPNVRAIIDDEGSFPTTSYVGTQAVREFDGQWEANELTSLLADFDAYIESVAGQT